MMNYHHLYYFHMVATKCSFTEAARFLRLQQPSLSAQIKSLEENLGYTLFFREGRKIRLTPQGEVIFKYCQRIFDAGQDLENYLTQHLPLQTHKRLRIGVTEQIDPTFVADLFSNLMKNQKEFGSALLVVAGRRESLLADMKNQNLDLILSNTAAREPDFAELVEVNMPVGLFMARSRLKTLKMREGSMTPKDLLDGQGVSLVLPTEKLRLRHETDSYLHDEKIRYHIVFESDLISVVARAIMEGIGAGFLPIPYMEEELSLGLVKMIGKKKSLWSQKLFLIGRQVLAKDLRVRQLIESLQNPGQASVKK